MKSLLILTAMIVFTGIPLSAAERLFYREFNLIGGYSKNEHWVGTSETLSNSVGFEDYRKFSGDFGDFLTTDIQVRLAYDPAQPSGEAWAVEIHNAWAEFKTGDLKPRIGHFDPAFGLEPQVDTHGTIFQTLAMRDIGFTKDWGVGIKGLLPIFDYNAALTLGSGMGIRHQDGSFLATLRAGTPAGENVSYGMSFLAGKVLMSEGMGSFPRSDLVMEKAVEKKRVGGDAQLLWGPLLWKTEASYGTNDNTEVLGFLGELNYTVPRHQNWELTLQYKSWINDLDEGGTDDSTLSAGVARRMTEAVTMRAAYIKDTHLWRTDTDETVLVQVYYFGR